MTVPLVWTAATDVALAARRHLVSLPGVREVLGPASSTVETSWIFVRDLATIVEGTGLAAVVLSAAGGWARPNSHNSAQFPRLVVEVYADSSREANLEVTRPDAESRARYVWAVLERELHRTYAFVEVWGAVPDASPPDPGLRVWGSQALHVPEVFSVSEWASGARLYATYGLSTG